jgi:hypothetical protein
LEIIRERIGVHLEFSRIVDQALCFENEHFLPKEPKKHVFHKNLDAFFGVFPNMNYENALFIDDTPYKSLFNLPLNAIFLKTFYGSQIDGDYLLKTILHSDLQYEKLAKSCSSKCHDIFCNKMKFKPANK